MTASCSLRLLAEGCEKSGFRLHSYCLMSNHLHLVAETPHANLVEGMKWLLGVYTSRFNRRHKVFGHLFSGHAQARSHQLESGQPQLKI